MLVFTPKMTQFRIKHDLLARRSSCINILCRLAKTLPVCTSRPLKSKANLLDSYYKFFFNTANIFYYEVIILFP